MHERNDIGEKEPKNTQIFSMNSQRGGIFSSNSAEKGKGSPTKQSSGKVTPVLNGKGYLTNREALLLGQGGIKGTTSPVKNFKPTQVNR